MHVASGVIGVRIDGVEGVSFDGLHISNLREHSGLGSHFCGEYWEVSCDSSDSDHNYGGANMFQNAPYLYGYTGNYAHGIFSDFVDIMMSGKSVIEDIQSDTGLVRGIGLYTQSTLAFADDSSFRISSLSAGHRLYDRDTTVLNPPYNPAVAKPVHVVWTEEYQTYDKETINNAPDSAFFSCIYGRDGVNTTDWVMTVDNSDCGELENEIFTNSISINREVTQNTSILMAMVIAVIMALYVLCPFNIPIATNHTVSTAACWLILIPQYISTLFLHRLNRRFHWYKSPVVSSCSIYVGKVEILNHVDVEQMCMGCGMGMDRESDFGCEMCSNQGIGREGGKGYAWIVGCGTCSSQGTDGRGVGCAVIMALGRIRSARSATSNVAIKRNELMVFCTTVILLDVPTIRLTSTPFTRMLVSKATQLCVLCFRQLPLICRATDEMVCNINITTQRQCVAFLSELRQA